MNVTVRYESSEGRNWHPNRWVATIDTGNHVRQQRFNLYHHAHVGTVSAQKPYVLQIVMEWCEEYLDVTGWTKLENDVWTARG